MAPHLLTCSAALCITLCRQLVTIHLQIMLNQHCLESQKHYLTNMSARPSWSLLPWGCLVTEWKWGMRSAARVSDATSPKIWNVLMDWDFNVLCEHMLARQMLSICVQLSLLWFLLVYSFLFVYSYIYKLLFAFLKFWLVLPRKANRLWDYGHMACAHLCCVVLLVFLWQGLMGF